MASDDESSCDESMQQAILARLDQYGDSVVGESQKSRKERKKLQKKQASKGSVLGTEIKAKIPLISRKKDNAERNKKANEKVKLLLSNKVPMKSKKVPVTSKEESESESDELSEDSDPGSDNDSDGADFDMEDWEEEEEEEEEVKGKDMKDQEELEGKEKKIRQMKEALGLLDEKFLKSHAKKKAQVDKKNVKVCGADKRSIQKKRPPPEVVRYEKPAKKVKNKDGSKDESNEREVYEFDMKTSRHEIKKMGIEGMTGRQKQNAMTKLLLDLGAKPSKNQVFNYKDYQQKIQKKQQLELEKRIQDKELGFKVKNSKKRYEEMRANRKKDTNDIGTVDGQIGSYKGGWQVLSKDDITKIKNTTVYKGDRRK